MSVKGSRSVLLMRMTITQGGGGGGGRSCFLAVWYLSAASVSRFVAVSVVPAYRAFS